MTAMPQMVALYNGMGGGAAGAIAAVELFGGKAHGRTQLVVTLLGALIGAVSLSGSLIAWAKLDGVIKKPLRVKGQQAFNGWCHAGDARVGGYIVFVAQSGADPLIAMPDLIYLFFGCALVFGILMTLADRRRGHAGRDLDLQRLHRPRGRPRRLRAAEPGADDRRHGGRRRRHAADAADGEGDEPLGQQCAVHQFRRRPQTQAGAIKGSLKPVEAGDAGIFMRYAKEVIIVPGYGLAVAQGQQKLYEFVKLLQAAASTSSSRSIRWPDACPARWTCCWPRPACPTT
jgi:NAD(P) transhydrogenase subunit beta